MEWRYERCVICHRRFKECHDVLFTVCPRCADKVREYRRWQNLKRKLFGEFRRMLNEN